MNPSSPLSTLAILLFALFSKGPLYGQCNGTFCTIPTPSVNAQDACILPNPAALDCYFGSTTFDPPVSLPPYWCTTIENNHFFAFIADAPDLTLQICAEDCSSGNAIQAALLSTVDCINFSFESNCYGNIGVGTCEFLVATGLVPGQVYYLMIDGSAGAICSYSINGSNANIYGQSIGLCVNQAPSTYSSNNVANWTIEPPSAGMIQGSATGASVSVLWTATGSAQLCAQSLGCPNAPKNCLDVLVGQNVETFDTVELCQNYTVECAGNTYSSAGNYTVTLPSSSGCDSTVHCIVKVIPSSTSTQTVTFCQGGSAFCAGEEFFAPGNYPVTLPTLNGCDSVVHCLIKIIPTSIVDLGTKYICQGDCFQLGDSLYCNTGNYEQIFGSANGCDSIVKFEIIEIPINNSAVIQTPQGQTITCLQPSLILKGLNQPLLTHLWKNNLGDTLSNLFTSIIVNTPGIYTHLVTYTQGGVTCTDVRKVLVKQNNSIPPVTATGGIIDAMHPTVQLVGNSIISGVTYHWTGPNGFSSSLRKPIVSVPGIYTLTVTNPQTGCSNTVTVEVTVMI